MWKDPHHFGKSEPDPQPSEKLVQIRIRTKVNGQIWNRIKLNTTTEAPTGAVEAHTEAMEARPGAVEAHPGAVEAHPGALQTHSGAVETHPGAV